MRPGDSVGSYRIVSLLGSGGQGEVYRVEHVELGRHRAMKVLGAGAAADTVERIRIEWRALGKLAHPNVVEVIDTGETEEGAPFFVMGLLEGELLSRRIEREGKLPIAEACAIAQAVLAALRAAHAVGVIHRDVKPSNVFLGTDGIPRLFDFGLARIGDGSGVTRSDLVVGSARYMPPEQSMGELVEHRADLYGVGLLLFEALTGQPPFPGHGEEQRLAHVNDTPPRVRSLVTVPSALSALIASALSKDPSDRPQSAEEFGRRLERAVEPRRWRGLAAGVVLSGVAIGAVALFRVRATPASAPTAFTVTAPAVEVAAAEPVPAPTVAIPTAQPKAKKLPSRRAPSSLPPVRAAASNDVAGSDDLSTRGWEGPRGAE